MDMAGKFSLLRWQENERGLFCCEYGLGKGVVVSCSKAIGFSLGKLWKHCRVGKKKKNTGLGF